MQQINQATFSPRAAHRRLINSHFDRHITPHIQSEPKAPFPEQKLPKPGLEHEMEARGPVCARRRRRAFCASLISQTLSALGRLDVLVSNAAHQNRKKSIEDVTDEEFDRTFKTNVYAYFRLVKRHCPICALDRP